MKDMKDAVLTAIESHKKNTCMTEDLRKDLGIDTSSAFVAFEKTLQEMEENYEICRTENGAWITGEMAGLYTGKLSVNAKGMGFINNEDGSVVKFDESDQADALNGDTVLYRCQKWQMYGEVVKVLVRAHTKVIGTIVGSMRPTFVPDDQKLRNKKIKLITPHDFAAVEGLKLQCKIVKYGIHLLTLEFERVVGHKDDPGVDILSVLLDHDIEPEFPEEVMDETMKVEQEVKPEELEGRTDLTNETIVTIDGDDSKDFDDAVGVIKNENGWLLKVNIADVSHYVTEGSALDKEALARGCSTYVTDRVVPMLPHQLSNGICSLNPHVVRLTLTCEMQVNRDGSICDYRLYPSYMRSTERMTYNNVNKILDGDAALCEQYKHLGTLFTDLADCADAIRSHRVAKGAIDFDSDEAKITLDENGEPISIELRDRGHAERMIEDCMIAANVCVANQMKWANLPCVYRVHEEPQAKRIKNFVRVSALLGHKISLGKSSVHPLELQSYLNSMKETPEYPVLSMMLLRCMQKAKYDPNCVGHFGLAEEEYLHFTSPIRRYPDLAVHRMLRRYVFEGCTDQHRLAKDEGLVQEYSEQSSIRERASQDAEYACDDMKKAQYMEKHVGERFDGIITSVTSYGFYVQLPNTIEGLVSIRALDDDYYTYDEDRMELRGSHSHHVYQIGQQVKVVVLGAASETGTIDFAIASNKKKERTDRFERNGRNERRGDRKPFGNDRCRGGEPRRGDSHRGKDFGKSRKFDKKDGHKFDRKDDRDFRKREDRSFEHRKKSEGRREGHKFERRMKDNRHASGGYNGRKQSERRSRKPQSKA